MAPSQTAFPMTALPNLGEINTARSVKRNGKPVQRPPKFADRPWTYFYFLSNRYVVFRRGFGCCRLRL